MTIEKSDSNNESTIRKRPIQNDTTNKNETKIDNLKPDASSENSKVKGIIDKIINSVKEFGQNFLKPKNYVYAFGCLGAMLLSSYINDKMIPSQDKENSVNNMAIEGLIKSPVRTFIDGSLGVALFEESFYRKFIMDLFSHYTNKPIAYFVSCSLFTFEHFLFDFKMVLEESYRLPIYITLSFILAYTYDHAGTIVPTVIAHTLNNILGFIELYNGIKK